MQWILSKLVNSPSYHAVGIICKAQFFQAIIILSIIKFVNQSICCASHLLIFVYECQNLRWHSLLAIRGCHIYKCNRKNASLLP